MPGVADKIHFEWVCRSMNGRVMKDSVRKKHRDVHEMCQDTEDKELSTEEFDVVRSKVPDFYSIQSLIVAQLKAKTVKELNYANIRQIPVVMAAECLTECSKHYIQTQRLHI